MMTSRLTPWSCSTRSSSLALRFGLQHGLVEVEERVGGEGHLLADRGGERPEQAAGARSRSRRGQGQRAGGGGHARGGGGGGGGGLSAPSQPGCGRGRRPVSRRASTVRWCRSSTGCRRRRATGRRRGVLELLGSRCLLRQRDQRSGKCSRCKKHRHLVQFLHDSPLEESRSCLRNVQNEMREIWANPHGCGHLPPTNHCAIGRRPDCILAPASAAARSRAVAQPRQAGRP